VLVIILSYVVYLRKEINMDRVKGISESERELIVAARKEIMGPIEDLFEVTRTMQLDDWSEKVDPYELQDGHKMRVYEHRDFSYGLDRKYNEAESKAKKILRLKVREILSLGEPSLTEKLIEKFNVFGNIEKSENEKLISEVIRRVRF